MGRARGKACFRFMVSGRFQSILVRKARGQRSLVYKNSSMWFHRAVDQEREHGLGLGIVSF